MSTSDLRMGGLEDKIQVASASRSNRDIDEIPSTIFVITADEIQRNGYVSLIDVLKSLPGIKTSQPGSPDEGDMFLMRGMIGNSYVKILINNIPIQPSVSGILPIGEQLPISQAERIEVVYGPASAVYGADAMAGIINIITKSPNERVFATLNSLIGSDDYRHLNFTVGGKSGKNKNIVNYSFYGNFAERGDRNIEIGEKNIFESKSSVLQLSGLDKDAADNIIRGQNDELIDEFIREIFPFFQGSTDNPEINELPHTSRLLGFDLRYKNFSFFANELYREDHSALGRNPYVTSFSRPDALQGESIQRYAISYNKGWQRTNLMVNTSYLRNRFNRNSIVPTNYLSSGFGTSYSYSASDDIFGEALLRFSIKKKSEITIGTSGTYSGFLPHTNLISKPFNTDLYKAFSTKNVIIDPNIGDFGYYPGTSSIIGGFVQYYYTGKKLTLLTSLRLDSHSEYDTRIYSRYGLTYKIGSKLTLRAAIGYAFKAPVPNYTYLSLAIADIDSNFVRYVEVPNTNLSPEELSSVELGLRYRLGSSTTIDLSLFSQEINQLIVSRNLPLDTTQYPLPQILEMDRVPLAQSYVNDELSNSYLLGLQLSIDWKGKLFMRAANSRLHLALSGGIETLPETGRELNGLRMQPDMIGTWTFSFSPINKLYINVENHLLSGWYKRYVPTADFEEDELEVEGYYNLDATIRYQFNESISIFSRVTNLTNSQQYGIGATSDDLALYQNPQMGRFIRLGLNFSTK